VREHGAGRGVVPATDCRCEEESGVVMTEKQGNEVEQAEFEKQYFHFFALIGHCVTQYQTLEDFLPNVFAVALGINEVKAQALLNIPPTLEPKLEMISVSLSDAAEEHQQRWKKLRKHIDSAKTTRNKIAHGRPVIIGGGVLLNLTSSGVEAKKIGTPHMELHKQKGKDKVVLTTELLMAEYRRADKLFSHLLAFVCRLKGQKFPAYLEEPFEPATEKQNKKQSVGKNGKGSKA
jgi:hypothetical protein